jgi:hypothetical protein
MILRTIHSCAQQPQQYQLEQKEVSVVELNDWQANGTSIKDSIPNGF